MKVYLAAPFGEREAQREIAKKFVAAGHVVTSRWIEGGEFNLPGSNAAQLDLDDVAAADCLVLKTFPHGTLVSGGGRHFEFGFAYGIGKTCIVVGDKEHIFCHLTDVKVVPTYDAAIELLV